MTFAHTHAGESMPNTTGLEKEYTRYKPSKTLTLPRKSVHFSIKPYKFPTVCFAQEEEWTKKERTHKENIYEKYEKTFIFFSVFCIL